MNQVYMYFFLDNISELWIEEVKRAFQQFTLRTLIAL